jgi:hypothetical protein
MKKRGQVALFLILGLVVVIIISLVYFFRADIFKNTINTEDNEKFVSSRLEPIKTLVQGCVEKSALKGLILLGKQGGRYNPYKYEDLAGLNVSYSCYTSNHQSVMQLPLIVDMENEFNRYMVKQETKQEIGNCINNFESFKSQGLNVKEKGLLAYASHILDNDVQIDIKYPLEISKGDYTATIKDMAVDIPVGLGKAHKIAVEISNKECIGEEFDYDKLGLGEPIVTSSIESLNQNKIIYLKTIPSSNKEIPIDFNFIIQK